MIRLCSPNLFFARLFSTLNQTMSNAKDTVPLYPTEVAAKTYSIHQIHYRDTFHYRKGVMKTGSELGKM